LAGTYFRQDPPNLCHQRSKVFEPVTLTHHGDDPDVQSSEILLERDMAINREKNVESPCRDPQESPVFHAGPPFLLGRTDFVVRKLRFQPARYALIEEDTHPRATPPSRAREPSPLGLG